MCNEKTMGEDYERGAQRRGRLESRKTEREKNSSRILLAKTEQRMHQLCQTVSGVPVAFVSRSTPKKISPPCSY